VIWKGSRNALLIVPVNKSKNIIPSPGIAVQEDFALVDNPDYHGYKVGPGGKFTLC